MILASLVLALSPADWPQWRGPDRQGISIESNWVSRGNDEPVWTKEVGLGYSNVVIADGRLFTRGFDLDNEQDVMWCLDADTGEELWSHRFAADHLANFHGGGTLSSPTIHGEVVYSINRFGLGFCRRVADGEIVWQRDYKQELGLELTFHGYSASPLVIDDQLVLVLGGTVLSVSLTDGAIVWKSGDYGDGGYANPVPLQVRDRSCLAVFTGQGLMVLDRSDGTERYRYPWKSDIGGVNAATPVLVGDGVFISSAYQMGCAMIEFDADEAKTVWSSRKMRNKVSDTVVWEGHLYGFDESMLRCLDVDGNEQWRVRGLGMGSLSMADGRLIVLSSKGELIIARATPERFDELSRTRVLEGGVYWTAPVIHAGRIYCRNSLGQLTVRDHRSGGAAEVVVVDPETPTALPPAETLFAKHVEAIGGEAAIRAHRSARMSGRIEILGAGITGAEVTIQTMAPDQWRMFYELPPYGEFIRGYDGEIGWEIDLFFGNRLYEGDRLRELAETTRFYRDLEYASAYTSMRTVGALEFGGHPCWAVQARTTAGTERTVYFDRRSGLIIGRDGPTESMVIFDGYEAFDSVMVPTRVTVLIAETGAEESFRIDSVVFDDVDPAVFQRTDEVIRLLRTPEQIETENVAARQRFAEYLGAFVADFPPYEGMEIEIVIEDGKLSVAIPDQRPFALRPPDDGGVAYLEITDQAWVEFVRGESGVVVMIKLNMLGNEHVLPRADGIE